MFVLIYFLNDNANTDYLTYPYAKLDHMQKEALDRVNLNVWLFVWSSCYIYVFFQNDRNYLKIIKNGNKLGHFVF